MLDDLELDEMMGEGRADEAISLLQAHWCSGGHTHTHMQAHIRTHMGAEEAISLLHPPPPPPNTTHVTLRACVRERVCVCSRATPAITLAILFARVCVRMQRCRCTPCTQRARPTMSTCTCARVHANVHAHKTHAHVTSSGAW